MERLSERIMERAANLPEGAPVAAKGLLHLGSRAAVDQALSRLQRRGQLLRAGRGLYVRPVNSRFGSRAPSVESLLEFVATRTGETIVASGAASASKLGLTSQVPVRAVYLTSGPSRQLQLGKQVVELQHSPRRQLLFPHQPMGDALRALQWLGPENAESALGLLQTKLSEADFATLLQAAPMMPNWLAKLLSARGDRG
ncbi:hypothetical protein GFL63_20880 [Rhizobium leguminosarum bv. viciae]|uniref:DUF6088 family protein n=1 Tax=Rhizobium leguminosarum TaxID=384 RepID=UPI00144218D8|nr:DUF6088 family protein [Rhizobium leguminosarum]NKK01210.1 hypothetical protein [Rhizobium leguminosarum bv. viciae]